MSLLIALTLSGCTKSYMKSFEPNVIVTEPTATPAFKDENVNLINDAGWEIPPYDRKDGDRYSRREKTARGESRKVTVWVFHVKERVVADIPPHHAEHYEWLVTRVAELTGNDRRVFCFEITANPFLKEYNGNGMAASITRYRVCDQDGDGKFESKGFVPLVVPGWVK